MRQGSEIGETALQLFSRVYTNPVIYETDICQGGINERGMEKRRKRSGKRSKKEPISSNRKSY